MSARLFYLEGNGLLWLRGDLDEKQVEKNTRAKKREKEKGVEKTVRAKENEKKGTAEKREWLCIPKTTYRRILHQAHDTPAG